MTWIKVTNRMPDVYTNVLVTEKILRQGRLYKLVSNAGYYTGSHWMIDGLMAYVISWQPLPEPDQDTEE